MKTSSNDNEAVLTVAELAARWKCHRQSVMEKIHDEQITAFKIGRQYRVSLREVERYEQGRAA